ncbi:MAG: hypothetical protein CL539_00470 [Alcanivorax sp.]|uniref:hypothetical protein n=1 Tax=unclassified Alcanivorax TaxID=2638842 RepID=UPI000C9260D8|nr:hypothetical protein [Alcanivorax sp. UBA3183]MAC13140.1 hypothetical protein [Alcanivorax sp.]
MLLRQTLVVLLVLPSLAAGWEFRGETGLEGRYFTQASPYEAADYSTNSSLYLKGEVFHEWNNRDDQFIFIPYARVDENDSERTHADIRELSWIHVGSGWESRVGIRKVFWGVTEGRHLVDIINQTDLVDQVDGEEKLGQPMLNLSTVRDWGIVDLFVLPGFRERTYAGEEGRPRTPLPVSDHARYESGAEDKRVDVAFRYQQYFNNGLELALSHFSGTSREPLLLPEALSPQQLQSLLLTGSLPAGSDPELVPLYNVIDQTGLELQYLNNGWLWKLEAITRSGQGDRFTALDGGFEYTQVGVLDSAADLGWLLEYLWEDRDELLASPFQDDVLLATRFTFNDVASTEILAGVIYDLENDEKAINLESSRRFGNNLKASLEARFYTDTAKPLSASELYLSALQGRAENPGLSPVSRSDFIQAEVVYYF